ncbi:MAG: HAMP domain-containing histidine kinase [Euryarchaeota archaeon]|nr:HAMP domain-containing histidine kinase [Euryarchaeota archaeon]
MFRKARERGGGEDEYKQKIFDRFARIEKGGVKGTGLGLAIVKRIVDLHQGRAWVEDNPEGGSVFYVELPKKRLNQRDLVCFLFRHA